MNINQHIVAVEKFLGDKLDERLAANQKLLDRANAAEDFEAIQKLEAKAKDLRTALEPHHWIADAAKRVTQMSVVSHAAKFTHPKVKGQRGIYFAAGPPKPAGLITSTPDDPNEDVVCNARYLIVNSFLSLEVGGKTMLEAIELEDPEAMAALAPDAETARALRESFLLIKGGGDLPASHSNAKQIYFPIGGEKYHLLSPLFPSSMYHRIDGAIQNEKFGELAKAASKVHILAHSATDSCFIRPPILAHSATHSPGLER